MIQTDMGIIIEWNEYRMNYCKHHVCTFLQGNMFGHGCQHPQVRQPGTSWGECKPEDCPMKPLSVDQIKELNKKLEDENDNNQRRYAT
jgi:hypothetical protein